MTVTFFDRLWHTGNYSDFRRAFFPAALSKAAFSIPWHSIIVSSPKTMHPGVPPSESTWRRPVFRSDLGGKNVSCFSQQPVRHFQAADGFRRSSHLPAGRLR